MPWISIIAFFGHCKLYIFKVLFDGPVRTNLALYFRSIWLTFQRIAFDYFDFRFETAWKEPGGWSPHQSTNQSFRSDLPLAMALVYPITFSWIPHLRHDRLLGIATYWLITYTYYPVPLDSLLAQIYNYHLDFHHFHMHHSPLTYQETVHAQSKWWCLKSQRSVPSETSEINQTGKRISKSKSKCDWQQVLGVGNRIQFLPPLIDWYYFLTTPSLHPHPSIHTRIPSWFHLASKMLLHSPTIDYYFDYFGSSKSRISFIWLCLTHT